MTQETPDSLTAYRRAVAAILGTGAPVDSDPENDRRLLDWLRVYVDVLERNLGEDVALARRFAALQAGAAEGQRLAAHALTLRTDLCVCIPGPGPEQLFMVGAPGEVPRFVMVDTDGSIHDPARIARHNQDRIADMRARFKRLVADANRCEDEPTSPPQAEDPVKPPRR